MSEKYSLNFHNTFSLNMENITEEHTNPPFFSSSVIIAMVFICVGGLVGFLLMIMWCRLWCVTFQPEKPVKWLEVQCNSECPICLNNISFGAQLFCNHVFHISCIQTWIENKNICPLCRTLIK